MLTVKLQHRTTGRTRIVECESVEVKPAAREVMLDLLKDGLTSSFYIVPEDIVRDDSYTVAYVENAAGSTVQIVKAPYGRVGR